VSGNTAEHRQSLSLTPLAAQASKENCVSDNSAKEMYYFFIMLLVYLYQFTHLSYSTEEKVTVG
jgi:hypothetical protein